LQHRLADSEKRLNKLMEETSRNAGVVNVSEKLKQDLRKLTAELEKTHLDIQDRVREKVFLILTWEFHFRFTLDSTLKFLYVGSVF
jgi:hypothetical protein